MSQEQEHVEPEEKTAQKYRKYNEYISVDTGIYDAVYLHSALGAGSQFK